MFIFRILLLPLALLFGLIIQLRNIFYDHGIFRTHHFDKPIISIGNISAGGTGKTPFTIYLAEKFINKDKKVAIISRGYGRKSKGFHVINNKNNFLSTEVYGDEPVLMAKKLPGVIVAVAEKRKIAIDYILKNFDIDIILLDDAFQHRSVARDLDIVLQKGTKKFKNRLMLPAGLLREFKFNLRRANLVVNADVPLGLSKKNIFYSESKIDDIMDINFKTRGSLKEMVGIKCVAFAGIANPESFHENLKSENIQVDSFIPFKDHHNYSLEDIILLVDVCLKNKADILLCTEKDLVKISEIDLISKILKENNIKILAARLNVKIRNEKDFLENIKYLS